MLSLPKVHNSKKVPIKPLSSAIGTHNYTVLHSETDKGTNATAIKRSLNIKRKTHVLAVAAGALVSLCDTS